MAFPFSVKTDAPGEDCGCGCCGEGRRFAKYGCAINGDCGLGLGYDGFQSGGSILVVEYLEMGADTDRRSGEAVASSWPNLCVLAARPEEEEGGLRETNS